MSEICSLAAQGVGIILAMCCALSERVKRCDFVLTHASSKIDVVGRSIWGVSGVCVGLGAVYLFLEVV